MDSLYIDLSQSWAVWGIVLVIAFPLLVILSGERAHHLDRQASKFASLIRFGQRFIMPQLVLLLITTRIIELPEHHVLVKIIETLLWVFIIYGVVTLFNLLVFSESGGRWQIKAPKLLLEVMRIIIMALGIAIVLSNVWGFELGKMMAAFGVGSIVLGLALQDTMSSLFSGFSLISSKQFKEGDWLEVGGRIGKVIQVNWRSVTLLNRDEDIIIIPNSDLAKGQFVNFSHPYPHHVERVNFDFSFDDAPHKVKRVLIRAALETPGVLSEPGPQVALISYDEFTVRHEVRFWIADYLDLPKIRDSFVSRVWYVAKRHGLTFPTRAHEVVMLEPTAPDSADEQALFVEMLKRSPLLSRLDPDLLENIAAHSVLQPFGSGEWIIRQGEVSDDCFLLYSGLAREYYRSDDGEHHALNPLKPGDMFGIVSLVRDSGDEISVSAEEDSEVLVINEEAMHTVLDQHPELSVTVEQFIDAKMRELNALNIDRVASI